MSTTAVATPKQSAMAALVPKGQLDQIMKLDETAKTASLALIEAARTGSEMAKGMAMARAMRQLRELMTPEVMADIMELMNSPLGFKTDRPNEKNPKPYDVATVRDVWVMGLLRGLRPTYNEVNIIAGQLYVTKEGFERLVNELPGVSNLRIEVGVPKMAANGALVDCRSCWKFQGTPGELICEGNYAIPIKVNSMMGADAIQGKATSKMLRRIYKIITFMDLNGDDDDPIDTTATTLSDKPAPNDPSASNRS